MAPLSWLKKGLRGGKNQAGQGYKAHGSGRWRWFSYRPIRWKCFTAKYPLGYEVKLVEKTVDDRLVDEKPERLIGDRAYDSDPLDERLAKQGILLIAPHKSNRKKPKTQDGRELRRYRRRWKVERLFAWLQNYRRILVRYDRFLENYLAFVHLACIVIFVRTYF